MLGVVSEPRARCSLARRLRDGDPGMPAARSQFETSGW